MRVFKVKLRHSTLYILRRPDPLPPFENRPPLQTGSQTGCNLSNAQRGVGARKHPKKARMRKVLVLHDVADRCYTVVPSSKGPCEAGIYCYYFGNMSTKWLYSFVIGILQFRRSNNSSMAVINNFCSLNSSSIHIHKHKQPLLKHTASGCLCLSINQLVLGPIIYTCYSS